MTLLLFFVHLTAFTSAETESTFAVRIESETELPLHTEGSVVCLDEDFDVDGYIADIDIPFTLEWYIRSEEETGTKPEAYGVLECQERVLNDDQDR